MPSFVARRLPIVEALYVTHVCKWSQQEETKVLANASAVVSDKIDVAQNLWVCVPSFVARCRLWTVETLRVTKNDSKG